jgi:hypothetical protein
MAGTTWRMIVTKPRQPTVIPENINIARPASHPSGPYLSEDFYAAMMTGKLARYDAYDEARANFNRWKNLQVLVTFPHHKHVPPDVKHHCLPAPDISFTHPNFPVLL